MFISAPIEVSAASRGLKSNRMARRFSVRRAATVIAVAVAVSFLTVLYAPDDDRASASSSAPIACSTGFVYSVDGTGATAGTIAEVDTTTGETYSVGAFAADPGQQFNALAIPPGGRNAFALESTVTPGQLKLLKYDSESDSTTVIAIVASNHGYVAGAIDPTTGIYWWGGQGSTGTWEFSAFDLTLGSPLGPQFSTPTNNGGSGDLAFDSSGRLYLATTAGNGEESGNQLRYYDAPFESGGRLEGVVLSHPSPFSQTFNGLAFGADGHLYTQGVLGPSGNRVLYTLDPGTGTPISSITETNSDAPNTASADLASCASPSTLQLLTAVAGRYSPADQFTLTINGDGLNRNNTGTTTGGSLGRQDDTAAKAGPVLVSPGAEYEISEVGQNSTTLENYDTDYVCRDQSDSNSVVTQGKGSSAKLSIPAARSTGATIVCVIALTPHVPRLALTNRIESITDTNHNGITDAGDYITWLFSVTNTGETTLSGVRIVDDKLAPLDMKVVCPASPLSPTQSLVCTTDAPYVITAADIIDGAITDSAVAYGTPPGREEIASATASISNPPNTAAPIQKYAVSKTVDRASASPGEVVQYTVTVTNSGQVPYTIAQPATFTDDLAGILDDAKFNDDASAEAVLSGNLLSWSGTLAIGETRAITYSVTIGNKGDGLLHSTLVIPNPTGVCDSARGCGPTTTVRAYSLSQAVWPTHGAPGQVVTYTVTVTNIGRAAYTQDAPARLSDDLTGILDDAHYNNDGSSGAELLGNTLIWAGPLEIGERLQVTYSVTIDAPDEGDHQLRNVFASTISDAGCASETCISAAPKTPGLVIVSSGSLSTEATPDSSEARTTLSDDCEREATVVCEVPSVRTTVEPDALTQLPNTGSRLEILAFGFVLLIFCGVICRGIPRLKSRSRKSIN